MFIQSILKDTYRWRGTQLKGEVIPTFSRLVEIKFWLVGFQFAPTTLASKQNEIGQTSLSVPVDI